VTRTSPSWCVRRFGIAHTLPKSLGAGLVVMSSRWHGGISRALIGSTSNAVVRHAHCPVMVARKEEFDQEETNREMLLAWVNVALATLYGVCVVLKVPLGWTLRRLRSCYPGS
jgi:hypothetical protein